MLKTSGLLIAVVGFLCLLLEAAGAQQIGEELTRRRPPLATNSTPAEAEPAPASPKDQPVSTTISSQTVVGHSSIEIVFSCAVLLFGLILVGIESALAVRGILSENSTFRLIGLTIVVTAGLFVIPAGFSQNQMTPLMGLLGAIAGYLLGKDAPLVK